MAHRKHPNNRRFSQHKRYKYFIDSKEVRHGEYYKESYRQTLTMTKLAVSAGTEKLPTLHKEIIVIDTSKEGRPPRRTQYNDIDTLRKLLTGTNRHGKTVTIGERRKTRMLKRLEEFEKK